MLNQYELIDMKYSYIAGFFDGEGYISAVGSDRDAYVCLQIGVVNTDRAPIAFVNELFKSKIYEKTIRGNRKPQYRVRLCGYKAAEVLEKLMPYLITKKERALLGIQLIGASKEVQSEIYCIMRELNKKGIYEKKEKKEEKANKKDNVIILKT